jgi:DNA-binding NarL/FixJ family response regulator
LDARYRSTSRDRRRLPPASPPVSKARVADAAAAGWSNREIAARLFLSLKTVELHLGRGYRKLDIGSRGELPTVLASRLPEAV